MNHQIKPPTPGASQEVGENRQASQQDITVPDDADNSLKNHFLSYEHNPEASFRRGYHQGATEAVNAIALAIPQSVAESLYSWLGEVFAWRCSYEPSVPDWLGEINLPVTAFPPRAPKFSPDGTRITSHPPEAASEG
jgi:hypothetical protein